jgi:genome maintenance exonuclease 1
LDYHNRKKFNFISDFDQSKLDVVSSIDTDIGRVYSNPVTGEKYPSVTTVMSFLARPGIEKWKKSVGEEESSKVMYRASNRGTAIHDACERYILGEETYIDNNDYILHQNFQDIKKVLDNKVDNIYALERSLYSNFLGLAGKTDCIAEYDRKRSIIDFKTSRKIKQKKYITGYLMQATAYSIMFEELTGIGVPQIVIIISVDNEGPSVFIEKRDNYVDELLDTIKKYKKAHGDISE